MPTLGYKLFCKNKYIAEQKFRDVARIFGLEGLILAEV